MFFISPLGGTDLTSTLCLLHPCKGQLHSTNVEHVYGLGLTLNRICVYGLRLTWFYMTIENSVIMGHFYFGGQGAKFQNVFGDGSIKVTHCNLFYKTFVFWDAPQSIKLINLNHNKYPSSYESLGKELVMTKVRNENPTQTMRHDKMHFKNVNPRYSLK